MASKSALQDAAVVRAVEQRAPLLQFAHALAGLLRMDLGHAPVVKKFPAPHGVAEVNVPIVSFVHVGHGSSDSTLSHYGVGFAQQRFAYHSYVCTLRQGFDGGTQSGATRSDD